MFDRNKTAQSILKKRNRHFLKAQSVLKRLTSTLIKKYDAEKIILVGSMLDNSRFGFHSDIDLCVKGVKNSLYFKAVGELLMEAGEFDVDLIPFENIRPEMAEKVKNGKVLYEKRRTIS